MHFPAIFLGQRFDGFKWVCQSLESLTLLARKEVKADLVKEVLFYLTALLMIFCSRTPPLVLAFWVHFLEKLVILANADRALLSWKTIDVNTIETPS